MKTTLKNVMIPISKLKRRKGIHPEERYTDIDALTEDIRKRGLINPIIITTRYTIIDGGRRYEAYKKLGLEKIEAQIWPDGGDS